MEATAEGLPLTVAVPDSDRMELLGTALAGCLGAGDVLCLKGPLGAGKTTLVRGLARGLGIDELVASPTFVISRRHRGPRVDLVHCDAYRLSPDDDFADVVPDPEAVVTAVEWGEPVMTALSDSWLTVDICRSLGAGDDVRTVTIGVGGHQWDDRRVKEIVTATRVAATSMDDRSSPVPRPGTS